VKVGFGQMSKTNLHKQPISLVTKKKSITNQKNFSSFQTFKVSVMLLTCLFFSPLRSIALLNLFYLLFFYLFIFFFHFNK